MSLPRTLTHYNVFLDGISFIGETKEIDLPKLTRKMEGHRGGGMNGEVSVDLGMEPMEMTHTYAGHIREVYQSFGISKVDGVMLRFAGSYQRPDTGAVDAVEVVVRGRHKEIDPGKAKSGDVTELKVQSVLTYYKLTINGQVDVEIDLLNMVETSNGVDRLAEQRKAIGL